MSWSAGQAVVKASSVYMVPMYLEGGEEGGGGEGGAPLQVMRHGD